MRFRGSEIIRPFCQMPFWSLVCTIALAAAMFLGGMHLALLRNVRQVVARWNAQVPVMCMVRDSVVTTQIAALSQRIAAWKQVAHVDWLQPRQILQHFVDQGLMEPTLLGGVDEASLPRLLSIDLRPAAGLAGLRQVVAQLQATPECEPVDLASREWGSLLQFLESLQSFGYGLAVLIWLAVGTIVFNTVQLSISTCHEEIMLLQFMGANLGYISWPFVAQGSLWGLLAAGLAMVFLAQLDMWLGPMLHAALGALWGSGAWFASRETVLTLLFLSVFAGGVGAFLSVQRYLGQKSL